MSVNYLEQPKKANNSCKGGKKVVAKKKQKTPRIRRGEIYFANLNPVVGSEQGGRKASSYLAKRHRQQVQSNDDYRSCNIKT